MTISKVTRSLGGVLAGTAIAAGVLAAFAPPASAVPGGGNLDCPAGTLTLTWDDQPYAGQVLTQGPLTVTITHVDEKLDGSGEVYGFAYTASGATVQSVIVKGGPRAFEFHRTEDLDTFVGPGGRHYGISNIKFCYTTSAPA